VIVEYAGGSKFVARHRGLEVVSDQPVEKGGENAGMTPPELFIVALGACVGVYVVRFAERHDIPLEGLTVEADYETAEDPRRIGSIKVKVKLPQPPPEKYREALLRSARQCMVHNTITHCPQVDISLE